MQYLDTSKLSKLSHLYITHQSGRGTNSGCNINLSQCWSRDCGIYRISGGICDRNKVDNSLQFEFKVTVAKTPENNKL